MQSIVDMEKRRKLNLTLVSFCVAALLGTVSVCALNSYKQNTSEIMNENASGVTNDNQFVVFDQKEQKLKDDEKKLNDELKGAPVATREEVYSENLLSQQPAKGDKVTLNIRTGGRSNPFAPYVERSLSGGGYYDVVEPPQYIPDEMQDQDLMQTTVSGILYNAQKSSAIINVDGTDQLVNKGDKIAGFQIVNITKDKVYVKKGYNVIAAGVGETIEEPPVTYNKVYNLPNKFGGKYSAPKKGVILINGENY